MLKSIQIRNFGILNQLGPLDLHRINLVAGLNGCGKTSLLEAIFLLSGAGNSQLIMQPSLMRGIIPNFGIWAKSENPWRELFSNLDILQPIEIVGIHEEFGELKLEITLEKSLFKEIRIEQNGNDLTSNNLETTMHSKVPVINTPTVSALKFRHFRNSVMQTESKLQPSAQGVELSQPIPNPPFSATFVTSDTGINEEDARRLGVLKRKKLGNLLLTALKEIEPRLQSIEESSVTGGSMIYGDIGLDELVPLSVMGGGILRIAQLILAISSASDGVVVVDKIENSFHYEVLQKVWKVVDKATLSFNVQLISTTHSRENIEAAHSVLDQEHFRLHRLESRNGTSRCVTYDPDSINAAMKHGMEVR